MKTYQADLVIVGGGTAGVAAGVAALQQGAQVVILEKNNALGGNGFFPMGLAAVGSYVQKQMGIDADEDKMFKSAMEYSHWLADPRLNRKLLHLSGDTIKWLHDLGVEFTTVVPHYEGQYPFVYHKVAPPTSTGTAVMTALIKEFKRLGGTALTRTPGKSIIMENGRAVGAMAESEDGEELRVDAKNVLVCTGGFAGNNDLLKFFFPDYDAGEYLYLHGQRPTGDGVRMLLEAGGLKDWNAAIAGGAPNITSKTSMVSMLISEPNCIWLNKRGERFCDETVVYDLGLGVNTVSLQPQKVGYAILGKDIVDSLYELAKLNPGPGRDIANWDRDIADCIEDGELRIVSTLDEAAEFIGAPAEVVKAEIELYNHDCTVNRDSLFGKDRKYMQPINTAPYYVVKTGVDLLFTWGGIRCDHNYQVLNANREPIPGLYSAGNDGSGNVDGDTYHFGMSGHAFGYSVIGGRMVGEMLGRAK